MGAALKRLVICGGIGSGKSAVSARLASRGFVIVEADRLGHRVLQPGGEAFHAVELRWPQVVSGGRIDRGKLGGIVFSDGEALAELESLTHPHIRRRIVDAVSAAGARDVAVEIPLLADMVEGDGWIRVVVDAPRGVRRARLLQRGMDGREIDHRMSIQPSQRAWLDSAGYVLDNGGTMNDLDNAVDRMLAAL